MKNIFLFATILFICYSEVSSQDNLLEINSNDSIETKHKGELLYNGLRLPVKWPPDNIDRSRSPIEIPYLVHKPEVIFIDIGRQLFVDDFLIEKTSLEKVYHLAEKISENPVFKPETKVELNQGNIPVAAPFNDGLWYDSRQKIFKLWYHAGWFNGTGYATSEDGINWKRPGLDVVKGTNLVLKIREGYRRDGSTIWLDHQATNEQDRFKMFLFNRFPRGQGGELYNSKDGIHWNLLGNTSELGDNSGIFYNPFRKKWVFSIRSYWQDQRVRSYHESDEFYSASQWQDKVETVQKPVFWLKADSLDEVNPIIRDPTQFYDADVVAYESIMLGLFGIHRGPNNQIAKFGGFPKITDMCLGYSRDGFHFSRPDRRPFIGSTLKIGDWDRGYIHAVGGGCLVVGDKLYFYYSAWSGISPKLKNDIYAGGSMGLAILRRDGFVSLKADEEWGTLITRPVIFNGDYMFVNVDSKEGELQVEILNENYEPIKSFLRASCKIISVDSTIQEVNWESVEDLGALKGKKVRFKFFLKKGSLYSFWITPDKLGASYGFVAAGGPGLIGDKDTKGKRAYNVQIK